MAKAKARFLATGAAAFALATGVAPKAQEVVQALPPPGTQELNRALQRLAANGDNVSALIDAGDAALRLGDVAAAIGFYGRAQALTPSNPRIALGLARAYTLSRRPVEALRLFAEAERRGIALARMAADRGLAFDLVGDTASAQDLYRIALSAGADDAVRRNLALSQAISGDKDAFEATLLPLLEQGDFAAFRTRSFGLAILGEPDAAVKIARDMMTPQMSDRVEPYLRYMAELTPAQQAAAGALGVFPRAAAIGRDDAEIAGYTRSDDVSVRSADAALAPAGEAMGPRPTAPAGELPSVARSSVPPPAERSPVTRPIDLGAQPAGPAVASTRSSNAAAAQASPPPRENVDEAFANFSLGEADASPQPGAVDIRALDVPRETNEPAAPIVPRRFWVQLATGRDIAALGFDWRRISRNADGILAGKSAFTAPWGQANRLLAGPYDSAADARETVTRLRNSGLDSFPFTSAEGEEVFPLSGAPTAPAGPPAHPARHWVQVATGQDRTALGFDWRRISRRAEGALDGDGPFVVEWGQANRLLAGPYESREAARAMVNRLADLGIDSFPFSSDNGQAINPLN